MKMWAWGRMVPRGGLGWALVASVGPAVHVCVGGPSEGVCVGPADPSDWQTVVRPGLRVGPCQGRWPLAACGRVEWSLWLWTGVAGGPFVGAWCRGVAWAGRLWLPYSCG